MTDDAPQPADASKPAKRRRRTPVIFGSAVLAGAALGLAAVYGIGGGAGNVAGGCTAALARAEAIRPLVKGEVAALLPAERPLDLSALAFSRADGSPVTLADFAGRTVLLNLWATWCVPCREEMPALDGLQAALGGPGFEVVAVNLDTSDDGRDARFYAETGLTRLAAYHDRSLGMFNELKRHARAIGLPTSILVGPEGCEIGTLHGPAEWDSADGLALVRAAAALPPENGAAPAAPATDTGS